MAEASGQQPTPLLILLVLVEAVAAGTIDLLNPMSKPSCHPPSSPNPPSTPSATNPSLPNTTLPPSRRLRCSLRTRTTSCVHSSTFDATRSLPAFVRALVRRSSDWQARTLSWTAFSGHSANRSVGHSSYPTTTAIILWDCTEGGDIGLIYCSHITARLLVEQDGLNPAVVRAVPLHQRVYIDGVFVTLIDANHCPGAVVFVFELPPFASDDDLRPPDPPSSAPLPRLKTGPVYVHCGDFRYCREMGELFAPGQTSTDAKVVEANASTATSNVPSAFNHYTSFYAASSLYHLSRLTVTGVYLDTTYCKPQYNFPPQAAVVNYTLNVVRDILLKEKRCNERLRAQNQHSALSASTLSSAWHSLDSATTPAPTASVATTASAFLNGYQRQQQQRTLFLVGSFSIGKEKVFLEVARQFGMKIYASPAKLRLINQIELFNDENSQLIRPDTDSSQLMRDATLAPTTPDEPTHPSHNLSPFSRPLSWTQWSASDVLTSDIRCSRLHVVPLAYCSLLKLPDYLDPAVNAEMRKIQGCYHSVVCFRPTGWVGNTMRVSEKQVEISIVPRKEADDEVGTGKTGGAKGKRKRATGKDAKADRKVVHLKRGLQLYVHHIPYSEHSSYSELQEFVRLMVQCGLQQEQLIPTVNTQHTEQMCDEFKPIFAERRKELKEQSGAL